MITSIIYQSWIIHKQYSCTRHTRPIHAKSVYSFRLLLNPIKCEFISNRYIHHIKVWFRLIWKSPDESIAHSVRHVRFRIRSMSKSIQQPKFKVEDSIGIGKYYFNIVFTRGTQMVYDEQQSFQFTHTIDVVAAIIIIIHDPFSCELKFNQSWDLLLHTS